MKPYYEKDGITLFHADCREAIPSLSFDVVVTDPPYGCSATTGRGGVYDGFQITGDADTTLRDWLAATLTVPWLMFGSPRIPRPPCKAVLIWWKGEHTGMGDLSFPWKPDFEEVYIAGAGWSGDSRGSSILRHNARTDSGRLHPTEKPVALMLDLMRCAPPGIVLDPCMGSGTTLVAARDLGRAAIGCDCDERYCEIAARRLDQALLPFETTPT